MRFWMGTGYDNCIWNIESLVFFLGSAYYLLRLGSVSRSEKRTIWVNHIVINLIFFSFMPC